MHYQFMLCLHIIFGDVCPQVEDPVSTAFYRLSWQQDIGGGQEGPHTINLRCHWCARMSNQYVFNFVCEPWCWWVAILHLPLKAVSPCQFKHGFEDEKLLVFEYCIVGTAFQSQVVTEYCVLKGTRSFPSLAYGTAEAGGNFQQPGGCQEV